MGREPSTDAVATVLRAQKYRESLTGAQRIVADYILDHPEEVIHLSVREASVRTGTSEATVIRVCQALGFKGFQDMKIQLAQALPSKVEEIHGDIDESDTPATILKKTFQAGIRALQESALTIDETVFTEAVDVITKARQVLFFGVGTSGAVALDAADKFMLTGIPVSAYSDATLQVRSAVSTTKGDVVIGISQSGASYPVVIAVETARQKGATTIAITSRANSPITRVSDLSLIVTSAGLTVREFYNELRLAHLSVIDALYFCVALRQKETYMYNKQRTEEINRRLRSQIGELR